MRKKREKKIRYVDFLYIVFNDEATKSSIDARLSSEIVSMTKVFEYLQKTSHISILCVFTHMCPLSFHKRKKKENANLPRHNLFMHIVKQFSTSVLVNDTDITFKRIYQVPVPVMKIDSNILSPVSDTMLLIEIGCGVISWNFDWNLQFRRILDRTKEKREKYLPERNLQVTK